MITKILMWNTVELEGLEKTIQLAKQTVLDAIANMPDVTVNNLQAIGSTIVTAPEEKWLDIEKIVLGHADIVENYEVQGIDFV